MPEVVPGIPLQFCDWHCAENVRKRLAKYGYYKETRDKIMDAVWQYIKTDELFLLDVQRATLCQHLKQEDRDYMDTYRRRKEHGVKRCYNRSFTNLGWT